MSTEHDHLNELLARLRLGDQQAIAVFVAECSPFLLEVIRSHTEDDTRRVVDSQDILQSVWRSVFTHELPRRHFHDGQELLHFLLGVARPQVLGSSSLKHSRNK